jgi:hypothetical protein
MRNWYLYYRILHAVRDGGPTFHARIELQDVLIDLRAKAQREWPDATDQDIQDWFEHLSNNPDVFTEKQARHLTLMEPWATEEVTNV